MDTDVLSTVVDTHANALSRDPITLPIPPTALVLSFDVEEHHRIEAAVKLSISPADQAEYARRMERTTRDLVELLASRSIRATFYIVGQIAETHPQLVRAIADAGHEVASHSHAHENVNRLDPDRFRMDVRESKDALEQATGRAVIGYRAPTFSITRRSAWAIDILAEEGYRYDTSIFPVRHDRYGVIDAPRTPFVVHGASHSLIELPPLTWRKWGQNLPVAGGGYFRLFPLACMQAGIHQMMSMPETMPRIAMLYFHPWEFDMDQPRLSLGRISGWRTYVGIRHSRARLKQLIAGQSFRTAAEVVRDLETMRESLPEFRLEG